MILGSGDFVERILSEPEELLSYRSKQKSRGHPEG
jgi:hypothetical protein